jgi:multiple sugar transport system substrate-binding protein
MKKIKWAIAALVATTSLLPGLTNVTQAASPTTINFFCFSPGTTNVKDLNAMITAFEKKNPGIIVKPQIVDYKSYFTKLSTLVAAGNAPDVYELDYQDFAPYVTRGQLLNMGPLMTKEHFNQKVLNQKAVDTFKYQGSQYGLPESFSTVVLFYNKTLFDKAHVPYPNSNWTWKDELAAAQKLTKAGVFGDYQPVSFYEFYKEIAENGGSMFNSSMTKVTINSPQNVQTLNWMVDRVNKYKVQPTDARLAGQSADNLFAKGILAMDHTGIWNFSMFSNSSVKWDIALEPGNKTKAAHFFANALVVSKTSKYAEASYKWAQFMSASPEAAKIRINAGWEIPAVSDQSLVKGYLKQSPPQNRAAVFQELNYLVNPPIVSNFNQLQDTITNEFQKVVGGLETSAQALKNLQSSLQVFVH